MLRPILVLLLFIFGLSTHLHAEIEVIHDRFTGDITLRTKSLSSPRGKPNIFLIGSYEKGVLKIAIFLNSIADTWRYLMCHRTHWLVDDKPFKLSKAIHDGSTGSGYVLEHVIIRGVTVKQIEQLARAKKIEFKICTDEYVATSQEVEDFRVFLLKIREHFLSKEKGK